MQKCAFLLVRSSFDFIKLNYSWLKPYFPSNNMKNAQNAKPSKLKFKYESPSTVQYLDDWTPHPYKYFNTFHLYTHIHIHKLTHSQYKLHKQCFM